VAAVATESYQWCPTDEEERNALRLWSAAMEKLIQGWCLFRSRPAITRLATLGGGGGGPALALPARWAASGGAERRRRPSSSSHPQLQRGREP
jgi:hypothetical protein